MMSLLDASALSFEGISGHRFDAIVCASGYESRASYVAGKLGREASTRKIALGFKGNRCLARSNNDDSYGALGYAPVVAEGDSQHEVEDVMSGLLSELNDKTNVEILVDYTSMTRVWYASIIRVVRDFFDIFERVNLYLTYTPSVYAPPQDQQPNDIIGPLEGFSYLSPPDRKVAAIIGLGYESERALGLMEYLEPATTYLFYTDPALEEQFVQDVLRNNSMILERVGRARTLTYPLANLAATAWKLSSVSFALEEDYRVILAPLGPKPFTVLSLLLACKQPTISVWRVSPGPGGHPYERPAREPILVCKAVFENK